MNKIRKNSTKFSPSNCIFSESFCVYSDVYSKKSNFNIIFFQCSYPIIPTLLILKAYLSLTILRSYLYIILPNLSGIAGFLNFVSKTPLLRYNLHALKFTCFKVKLNIFINVQSCTIITK